MLRSIKTFDLNIGWAGIRRYSDIDNKCQFSQLKGVLVGMSKVVELRTCLWQPIGFASGTTMPRLSYIRLIDCGQRFHFDKFERRATRSINRWL